MATPDPENDLQDVVAIDGPSGSGKSTVARALAARLGYQYLDTGAMYRAVTWHFLAEDLDFEIAGPDLDAVLASLEIHLGDGLVHLNGKDVTAHLRSREVESRVSAVSAMPAVRKLMRRLQREIARRGPVVAEGRDMGTVVYPRARWKFFLDARPEERARRRLLDFESRGRIVTLEEVLEEIEVRDHLDSSRKDAPLSRAEGAVFVDTTGMGPDEVVEDLYRRIAAA